MPFVGEQAHVSIKNILLATVFTAPSEAILAYAVSFARRYGSKMSLMGAASLSAICEIVRKCRVDLVIIGTQAQDLRRSDLDMAVGEILRTVPCPMLIIGPKVTSRELVEAVLEQIVYVTDYTVGSLDGLPYTLALSQEHGAQLTFVHVSEGPTVGPFHFGNSRIVGFRKRLESLLGSREELAQDSELAVQEGDRVETLATIARSRPPMQPSATVTMKAMVPCLAASLATSSSFDGSGTRSPSSIMPWMCKESASCAMRAASSRVRPAVIQPGKSGKLTP